MANLVRKASLTRLKKQSQSASVTTLAIGAAGAGVARATLGKPDGSLKIANSNIDAEPIVSVAMVAVSTMAQSPKTSKLVYDLGIGVMLGYVGNAAWRALKS